METFLMVKKKSRIEYSMLRPGAARTWSWLWPKLQPPSGTFLTSGSSELLMILSYWCCRHDNGDHQFIGGDITSCLSGWIKLVKSFGSSYIEHDISSLNSKTETRSNNTMGNRTLVLVRLSPWSWSHSGGPTIEINRGQLPLVSKTTWGHTTHAELSKRWWNWFCELSPTSGIHKRR